MVNICVGVHVVKMKIQCQCPNKWKIYAIPSLISPGLLFNFFEILRMLRLVPFVPLFVLFFPNSFPAKWVEKGLTAERQKSMAMKCVLCLACTAYAWFVAHYAYAMTCRLQPIRCWKDALKFFRFWKLVPKTATYHTQNFDLKSGEGAGVRLCVLFGVFCLFCHSHLCFFPPFILFFIMQ